MFHETSKKMSDFNSLRAHFPDEGGARDLDEDQYCDLSAEDQKYLVNKIEGAEKYKVKALLNKIYKNAQQSKFYNSLLISVIICIYI